MKKYNLGNSTKIRNEFDDYDYINHLSLVDLKWLKAFHREYLNADFKHKYKRIHKKKKDIKNIYDMNNSRNRDVYARAKVEHKLYYASEHPCTSSNKIDINHEENILEIIDLRSTLWNL